MLPPRCIKNVLRIFKCLNKTHILEETHIFIDIALNFHNIHGKIVLEIRSRSIYV